ncbi:MAG: class I SAM-dependent methyltransferase [Lachnospiraceae bacterium]|nr:class I SAM-dependent methyltransferase [Lachnospiraceae bacterium]
MSFTDNFGHPKGFLGRIMLASMDREHLPMAEWAFTRFEIPREGEIVDIGCGGGYNIKRILSKCTEGKIYGFDISEESVKKARKVNKDQIGKRVEILQGSVEKMPFDDGQFDLATAFETVFFWPDPKENIHEVYRILKNGGRFVIINNYGDPNIDWEKKVPCMTRYTAEQLNEFMTGAGFKDIKTEKKDNLFCIEGTKQMN